MDQKLGKNFLGRKRNSGSGKVWLTIFTMTNFAQKNIPMAYVTDDPMNQVLKFGADLISKS